MWTIENTRVGDRTLRWSGIDGPAGRLSFAQVRDAWRGDRAFRECWVANLKRVSFDAWCWECPPVNNATLGRPFECVFLSSPSLARMGIDRATFAEHFRPGCGAVTFGSLGGDATLVAPCPEESGNFAHLASFTATASPERQDALWRAVGEALASRMGPQPLWLSTAGHGVAWLHVRLDSRPKYYRHAPYLRAD